MSATAKLENDIIFNTSCWIYVYSLMSATAKLENDIIFNTSCWIYVYCSMSATAQSLKMILYLILAAESMFTVYLKLCLSLNEI